MERMANIGADGTGRLAGAVAFVTGAASGIGRAGAVAFAAEGASVVLADIDVERARAVATAIESSGGVAWVEQTDVTDSESVRNAVAATVARSGTIDVLFHCAVDVAFVNHQDRRVVDLDDDVWTRMIDLVLTGTFRVCREVGRQMMRQQSGSIVITGTTDALVGVAGFDSYSAAKGGVLALTRAMAVGMASDGVRVNAICPAFVASENQLGWLADPEGRAAIQRMHLLPIPEPEDIAPFAVFLASEESRAVTGALFPADAGYLACKTAGDPVVDVLRGAE